MFEMMTWIDWSIVAAVIAAIGGLVFYFRNKSWNEILTIVEEVVEWVDDNLIDNPGAEKLETAVKIILERFASKSFIVRMLIKGLDANAGAKLIDLIEEALIKLKAKQKED